MTNNPTRCPRCSSRWICPGFRRDLLPTWWCAWCRREFCCGGDG